LLKNYKRNLLATIASVILLLLAFPTVASAEAAITSFSMDRTSITQGESVTFTLRTTDDVNYVFADVDGVRVQGTRQASDSWQLVVSPATTQNITIIANSTNTVNNAAMVNIPIAVTAPATIVTPPTTTVTPGSAPPITLPPITAPRQPTVPQQPAPPITLLPHGTFAIHSITEMPSPRTGDVHLQVVVATAANEVWVQFDGNRYRRGTEVVAERTDTTRTFDIIFRPSNWAVQTVRVSANREYIWQGATTRNFTLELTPPAAPAVLPRISQVSAGNRTLSPGASTTITVTTNPGVNYVWATDVGGVRREATRTHLSASTARWTVTVTPPRSGNVRVYANTVDANAGAVSRSVHITVQEQHALIESASATADQHWNQWTGWGGHGNIRVTATTNLSAERVWVDLPDGRRQDLSLQSTGTSTRTWVADISYNWNWYWQGSTVTVHASRTTSLSSDASRTVTVTGLVNTPSHGWTGNAWASIPSNTWVHSAHITPHWMGANMGVVSVNTFSGHNILSVSITVPWTGVAIPLMRSTDPNVWVADISAAWWGNTNWNTAGWWGAATIRGTLNDGTSLPVVSGTWQHW